MLIFNVLPQKVSISLVHATHMDLTAYEYVSWEYVHKAAATQTNVNKVNTPSEYHNRKRFHAWTDF